MDIDNYSVRYQIERPSKSKDVKFLFDLTDEYKNRSNSNFWSGVSEKINSLDESKYILKDGRTFKNGLKAAIGLIGEYGLIGYTIRQAQSIIRLDKQPSYWSHSFLFYDNVPKEAKNILSKNNESPLIWESTTGLSTTTPQINFINGVGPRFLRDYNKSKFDIFSNYCIPNVAVIIIALNDDEVRKILERASEPNIDSLRYDFSSLIGTWFSYIFKKQNEENPLGAGHALYSAAYCQLAYDAIGLDLSTGMYSRNTSPESIWASLKIFHEQYSSIEHPMIGFYCTRDPYCQLIPYDERDKFTISMEKANSMIRSE